MAEAHLDQRPANSPFERLVHLYLPSHNNPRFANRLIISKMAIPNATNLSFNQTASPRCLHSKANGADQKRKGDKSGLRITIKQRSKALSGIEMILSARYNKKTPESDNCEAGPLTSRDDIKVDSIEKSTIERWRSINRATKQKQQRQKSHHCSQEVEREVRTSISRMLQQSKDRESFEYITKFYRKPIEREIAVRKVRRETKNISEILNVAQYRPHSQLKGRYHKTIQPRCRCHKNSPNVDPHRMSNTSQLPKRPRQSLQQGEVKKPQTTSTGHRKIITLNLPQNWVVDSWNTQSRTLNEGIYEKCQFHD